MGKRGFPPFSPFGFRAVIERERAIVRYPFRTFSPSKSQDDILFYGGRAVTPHVSNLQDYVNHIFKRP
jgi:hypothetical protein